ncbi:MAG TPA: hypothetical protein VFS67_33220 [Polyangiaceae bacterium]|nr:hypothetical protein [Polyangiaceae bacterium]
MSARKLLWGLLGCGTGALLAFGCVIEEREYNPALAENGTAEYELLPKAKPPQCQEYCRAVKANCTGGYAVYLEEDRDQDGIADDCMSICQRLPAGSGPNDKSNSVACRQAQSIAASSEQSVEACSGAGPGGNRRCGDTCEAYCRLRINICGDQTGQDVDYDRCMRGCATLEPGDVYDSDPMARKDTLQCRLNHLVFASRSPGDAAVHCPHTYIVPQRGDDLDPPCADQRGAPGDCEKYCALVMQSCTEGNLVYESAGQCLAVCKAFPLGKAEETGNKPGENTVACRRYHAYAALGLEGPVIHCPHAGPTGDGHCGAPAEEDNCFSYCRILKRACTARFYSEYLVGQQVPASLADNPDVDDLGTCPASCQMLAGSGPNSGYSVERAPEISALDDADPQGDRGDALQCRVFHAIRALAGSTGVLPNPAECGAAFGDTACP